MDEAAFFSQIRSGLFGGTLGQSQVDGLNNLLSEWGREGSGDSFDTVLMETPVMRLTARMEVPSTSMWRI